MLEAVALQHSMNTPTGHREPAVIKGFPIANTAGYCLYMWKKSYIVMMFHSYRTSGNFRRGLIFVCTHN